MRKNLKFRNIQIVWASFALLTFIIACSSKQDSHKKETEALIREWVDKTKLEESKCDQFSSKVDSYITNKNPNIPLKEKKALKELSENIAIYPGVSQAAKNAIKVYLSNALTYPDLDVEPMLNIKRCNIVSLYDAVLLALNSAETLYIPKREKAKLSQIILDKVLEETSDPGGLIHLRILITIIEAMLSRHFISVSDSIYVAILELEEQVNTLNDNSRRALGKFDNRKSGFSFSRLKHNEQSEIRKIVHSEILETNRISRKLKGILARISI